MNKKIKKFWIKALRSGEFKEGRGALEKDGHYCALGVLSLLALVEGQCTYMNESNLGKFDNRKYGLSYNVMKWAEIAQKDDRFLSPGENKVILKYKGRLTSIAELNDQGVSFKEISKIIEKYL